MYYPLLYCIYGGLFISTLHDILVCLSNTERVTEPLLIPPPHFVWLADRCMAMMSGLYPLTQWLIFCYSDWHLRQTWKVIYIYIKKKKWNACHSFEVTLRSRFSCTNNKGAICMHPSWPLWRKHKSEAVVLAEPEWGILVLWRLSFASACYLLRLVIHILKYLLNWWTRSSPDGLWEIGSLILLTPLPCSKRYSFKVV